MSWHRAMLPTSRTVCVGPCCRLGVEGSTPAPRVGMCQSLHRGRCGSCHGDRPLQGAQEPWVIVRLRTDEIRDFGHTISPRISFLAFKLRTVILPCSLHRLVVRIKDKRYEKTLHAYSIICMQVIRFIIFA